MPKSSHPEAAGNPGKPTRDRASCPWARRRNSSPTPYRRHDRQVPPRREGCRHQGRMNRGPCVKMWLLTAGIMALSPLPTLSPLDGRYSSKVEPLPPVFQRTRASSLPHSHRNRGLQALAAEPAISEVPAGENCLPPPSKNSTHSYELYGRGRRRRSKTRGAHNHDVKAIEIFPQGTSRRQRADAEVAEFIHFALHTSKTSITCATR